MNKNYHVVVHFEGAYDFDIKAASEEEAKEVASLLFADVSAEDIVANLEGCDVCDCWADEDLEGLWVENYRRWNPETGEYDDLFDYEAAGLHSPEDCNDVRLCCGCKFEYECCGVESYPKKNK